MYSCQQNFVKFVQAFGGALPPCSPQPPNPHELPLCPDHPQAEQDTPFSSRTSRKEKDRERNVISFSFSYDS
jgi:hypothetical protein